MTAGGPHELAIADGLAIAGGDSVAPRVDRHDPTLGKYHDFPLGPERWLADQQALEGLVAGEILL